MTLRTKPEKNVKPKKPAGFQEVSEIGIEAMRSKTP